MYRIADALQARSGLVRRQVNRLFYNYLARLDRHGTVTLMNYGYSSPGAEPVPLEPHDEPDRLCLQLYHHVASAIRLDGLDVLEVGSGRGGGASFVRRYLGPSSVTGVDYSDQAVAFCQCHHRVEGLRFVHGDAENLPFEDGSFDAVLNVESSHCYGEMKRFLGEVRRVLRPGGYLLWADHRQREHVGRVREDMRGTGFEIAQEEEITPSVLAAMARQGERNLSLINQGVPRPARRIFAHFAGVEGTHIYNQLAGGHLVYLRMLLRRV
jgi:ubiquinone/menaquinone biosynthesis C-methylase UbiE